VKKGLVTPGLSKTSIVLGKTTTGLGGNKKGPNYEHTGNAKKTLGQAERRPSSKRLGGGRKIAKRRKKTELQSWGKGERICTAVPETKPSRTGTLLGRKRRRKEITR